MSRVQVYQFFNVSVTVPPRAGDFLGETMGKGYFKDREGGIRVFEGARVESDLEAYGDLWIGRGAVIRGNIKVEGDLIMEPDAVVEGSAFVRGSANFKENSLIKGDVRIEGHIYRGNNPPPYMFRRARETGGFEENSRDAEALALIKEGRIREGVPLFIREQKPELSYAILRQFFVKGMGCLIVGREPPERIRETKGLPIEDENVIWLTTLVGKRCFNPTHLNNIASSISKFIDGNRNGVILVDGIEYLITNNGFEQVVKFLNRLQDMIASSSMKLVVSVDPRTMDKQSLALLEKGSYVITAEAVENSDHSAEEKMEEYVEKMQELVQSLRNITGSSGGVTERLIERIEAEMKEMKEQLRRSEIALMEMRKNKSNENSGNIHEIEEQLRENAELLLRAVLLAEKLSEERRKRE